MLEKEQKEVKKKIKSLEKEREKWEDTRDNNRLIKELSEKLKRANEVEEQASEDHSKEQNVVKSMFLKGGYYRTPYINSGRGGDYNTNIRPEVINAIGEITPLNNLTQSNIIEVVRSLIDIMSFDNMPEIEKLNRKRRVADAYCDEIKGKLRDVSHEYDKRIQLARRKTWPLDILDKDLTDLIEHMHTKPTENSLKEAWRLKHNRLKQRYKKQHERAMVMEVTDKIYEKYKIHRTERLLTEASRKMGKASIGR